MRTVEWSSTINTVKLIGGLLRPVPVRLR
jgi:hypothetical protein